MTNTLQHAEAPEDPGVSRHGHGPQHLFTLALGSLGVVYGDIGTSPLYAFREAVKAASTGQPAVTEHTVLGVLSLIVWALLVVVTLKYVAILLNADNKGEGGTLSLMALAQRGRGKFIAIIPLLGMAGAALFYGDAIITPAISVLSAVEGLTLLTPAFENSVLWITLAIIIGLFAVQAGGTARVAAWFGPITLVWFAALAVMGLVHVSANPTVLRAVNPLYAVAFITTHNAVGLVTLGAVFLAVTGAEALYADLGHFGKRPIRLAWLVVVLPALVINYMGQGAFLLATPAAIENPFFLMVPSWALLPTVGLATLATIIASQAVITGAYSLTRQAVQLGLLPRMAVRFTSESQEGQIYMPQVNALLLVGVVILVLLFRSSASLSTAYGIAVTGTMVVTSLLAMFVITNRWRWPLLATLLVMGPLLAMDLLFLAANSLKIAEGGWLPLALGAAMLLVMWTWRTGTRALRQKTRKLEVPLKALVESLGQRPPHRVAGTAVFFTSDPISAPTALMHSLKHYKVLHERNVILTLRTEDVPFVAASRKLHITPLPHGFTSVVAHVGFMDVPDVPALLKLAAAQGLQLDVEETSFFLSRRTVRAEAGGPMPIWLDKLFIGLSKSANDASAYYRLPVNRVVEVGTQIGI